MAGRRVRLLFFQSGFFLQSVDRVGRFAELRLAKF